MKLDPSWFDQDTGQLIRLGSMPVQGPQLDLWRAPTDNDRGQFGVALEPTWRELGLHRLRHRLVDVSFADESATAVVRSAPAGLDLGYLVEQTWTAVEGGLCFQATLSPEREWPVPLPRLGFLLALPAELQSVTWFGGGPGEAYADSRQAARVGRHRLSIDDLQTPYVFPQENGNRTGVRWAELVDDDGRGLRVEGDPTVELTARRWTSTDLDRARHTVDLVARDRVYLNLDLAQNGLGTAACGPGVLPQYQLWPAPARFGFALLPIGP